MISLSVVKQDVLTNVVKIKLTLLTVSYSAVQSSQYSLLVEYSNSAPFTFQHASYSIMNYYTNGILSYYFIYRTEYMLSKIVLIMFTT